MPFSNHYRQIPIENGLLLYFPEILDKSESHRFMHRMKQEIQWKQETIRIFGNESHDGSPPGMAMRAKTTAIQA